MSAENTEIRRIDIGDGIYVLAPVPEAGPTGAPAATKTPSDFAAPRAWKLGRVAIAAASCAAGLALVRLGVTAEGVLAAGVLAVLVVLSAIDLQARVLPNRILYPATAGVLIWQLALSPERAGEWLLAAFGAGLFLLVPALVRPGAMGMGDVKLAVLLGAALGRDVLTALTLGFVGIVPVALWLLVRGSGVRGATVPFGPFLAFGAAVVLLV